MSVYYIDADATRSPDEPDWTPAERANRPDRPFRSLTEALDAIRPDDGPHDLHVRAR